jgi:hypothetical protein
MSEEHRDSYLPQALAETVLSLTELELKELELDFEGTAQSGRAAMRAALKSHRRQVRDAYCAQNRQQRQQSKPWLPPKSAQRGLLAKLLIHNPQLGLTLQHRELRELNDQDIEGLLLSLAELGVDLRELFEKE